MTRGSAATPRTSVLLAAGLGSLLHAVLLVLPAVVWFGHQRLIDVPMGLFLLLATLFLLADTPAVLRGPDDVETLRKVDGRSARFVTFAAALSIGAALMIAVLEHAAAGTSTLSLLAASGALFMAVGVLLRFVAGIQLGKYFVSGIQVRIGQPLRQTGIYGIVRHPSEAGNLFIVFGAAILLQSRIAVVVAGLVLLPLSIVRIGLEDRCLEQMFRHEFQRYQQRVAGLIPGIY